MCYKCTLECCVITHNDRRRSHLNPALVFLQRTLIMPYFENTDGLGSSHDDLKNIHGNGYIKYQTYVYLTEERALALWEVMNLQMHRTQETIYQYGFHVYSR
jgi:hypothetical protein